MIASSSPAEGTLPELVDGLRRRLEQAGERCEVFETHISLVLLAGPYAYKFKKPVDLGFVDFSTLALRKRSCEREVALNIRYAPGLYLDVVTVAATATGPEIGTRGAPIEYAVRMRRFPTDALLDRILARQAVDPALLERFARDLAALHGSAAPAPDARFGSPSLIREQGLDHLDVIADAVPEVGAVVDKFSRLLHASGAEIAARHESGCIRDCHGDLHLANIILFEGALRAFDCIEFNDELRYIDTASDLAFLLMDLDRVGAATLANGVMNAYLQETGDYESLGVMRFYLVYRALVRAKIAALERREHPADGALLAQCRQQVTLAARYLAREGGPGLVITHGVSGSGKTWFARELAARGGYVHLRSDIERKRLAGLAPLAVSGSGLGSGLYTGTSTTQTYERLRDLARRALARGWTTIVDASFLAASQRASFRALADATNASFRILDCAAPLPVLRERILQRRARGDDASEAGIAVLEHQLATADPLTAQERAASVGGDTALTLADGPTLGARRI